MTLNNNNSLEILKGLVNYKQIKTVIITIVKVVYTKVIYKPNYPKP